jgi:hypothetical protein
VKPWTLRLLPFTLLAAGCVIVAVASWHLILFALHSAQGDAINVWYLLLQMWFLGLSAYLIFTGLRKIRDENDVIRSKTPSITWGRILLGTFLIMSCSYNLIHPTQNKFEFYLSDENVKKYTNIFTFTFMLLGAWLVFSGVRARFTGPHKTTPHFKSLD